MIYFMETDTKGNICHICADPAITIVPLVNRVVFDNADGTVDNDGSGVNLSPWGNEMQTPLKIGDYAFTFLTTNGINNYTFTNDAAQFTANNATSPAYTPPSNEEA